MFNAAFILETSDKQGENSPDSKADAAIDPEHLQQKECGSLRAARHRLVHRTYMENHNKAPSQGRGDGKSGGLASKEAHTFVEHVRTIHFELIVTSISLIIAAFNRSGVVRQALDELRTIQIISDRNLLSSTNSSFSCDKYNIGDNSVRSTIFTSTHLNERLADSGTDERRFRVCYRVLSNY